MVLKQNQLREYTENGFLLLPDVFGNAEVQLMLKEMKKVIAEDCERRILEKNGFIRSFFAPEITSQVFNCVTRLNRLVAPAKQILDSEASIYQTKINTKHALGGDWWEWHQDYTFWKKEDGMPAPKVVTAMIYLTDVTEFNGPMLLIPGSHQAGTIDSADKELSGNEDGLEWFDKYQRSRPYLSTLTADLKYTLQANDIGELAQKNGIYSAKANSGAVLFFHGNVFHASSNNLSPWDRHVFLITYNSVENALPEMENPRPRFIVNRENRIVDSVDDDSLLLFNQ